MPLRTQELVHCTNHRLPHRLSDEERLAVHAVENAGAAERRRLTASTIRVARRTPGHAFSWML